MLFFSLQPLLLLPPPLLLLLPPLLPLLPALPALPLLLLLPLPLPLLQVFVRLARPLLCFMDSPLAAQYCLFVFGPSSQEQACVAEGCAFAAVMSDFNLEHAIKEVRRDEQRGQRERERERD